MNKKIFALMASMVLAAASLTGCGDSSSSSSGTDTAQPTEEAYVPLTDGPELYFSETTAAAGSMAEVSLCVNNADQKWSMCGIHVTFPDVLKCEMKDEENQFVKYTKGSASEEAISAVCMLWVNDLPEELTSKHLGSLFFTEVFEGDKGGDGEIAKFSFKIPDDAASGTVYPIGIYYMKGNDIFANSANETAFQEYAFANCKEGSITVQ